MDWQYTSLNHSSSNLLGFVPFILEGPRDQIMAVVQKEGRKVCVCVCVCPRQRLAKTLSMMWRGMDLIRLVKQVLQLL